MRVFLDFEMNRDAETINGNRFVDIEEIQEVALIPGWRAGSNTDDIPTDLSITLVRFGKLWGESIYGTYNLDGTKETFDRAIENYNKVINKLLVAGYCKISDFENVTWD